MISADGERFSRVHAFDGDQAVDVALLKVPGYGLPTLSSTAATPTIGSKVWSERSLMASSARSAALRSIPTDRLKAEGYGPYAALFQGQKVSQQ